MQKLLGRLLAVTFALSFAVTALARPPYPGIIDEVYGTDNAAINAAATGAMKCNICHVGMDKKMRNEFGKALSKSMTQADFNKHKADKEALAKALTEALKKTEAEKNAKGQTFGERIKAGMLPGG